MERTFSNVSRGNLKIPFVPGNALTRKSSKHFEFDEFCM